MKKTLIALAALAATGASFAQVTISGTVASGYKDQTAADGSNVRTSGFGVDTATLNFTAKEDIGGGQTIEAKFGLANVSRGATAPAGTLEPESVNFGPGDLTLTYTNTSFGRIQMGTERGSALMAGIPSAGAPVVDMDGKIYQLRSSNDFISYAAPIGPLIFAYKLGESSSSKGIGAGMSGAAGSTAMAQRTNDFALVYKQDALEVVGAYRSYDNRNANSMTTGDSLTKDSAIVLQAGYDFGPAKVGFGYNNVTASASPVKLIDMMVGISAPIGPLTVGATYGREEVSGVDSVPGSYFEVAAVPAAFRANAGLSVRGALSAANGVGHSVSFGAKYDLSKRTALTVNYARWQRSGYAQFEAAGATTLANATKAASTTFIGALTRSTTVIDANGTTLGQVLGGVGLTAALGTTEGLTAFNNTAGTSTDKAAAAIGASATQAVTAMTTSGNFISQLAATGAGSNTVAANAFRTSDATTGLANTAITNAQSTANGAAQAASTMGYKSDGSEFNIVLSYSF